jgi:unsaturated chondroitin disaccharide hydrolase
MGRGPLPILSIALFSVSALLSSQEAWAADKAALDAAVDDALAFGKARLEATIAALEASHPREYLALYPTSTVTEGSGLGEWKYSPATDWRSGFFPGALWQIYRATGDPALLKDARAWTAGFEGLKGDSIDYDLGNRFMESFGLEYRLSDDRNDPGGVYRAHAKEVLLAAAATLDGRFNMGGIPVGALRALDTYLAPYPVYIDGMMNLELLFEGSSLSGRPGAGAAKTWYDHAVTSAETKMRENVRADGSTYHVVQYNDGTEGTPPDGGVHAKITDQGYGNESTWSRGQAWALYGFTMVYRYTKDDAAVRPERFLGTARKTAEYFLAHLPASFTADPYNHVPGDFVPPTDFDAALGEPVGPWNDANRDHVYGDPRPPLHTFTERDSSAAAVAASGLLELCSLVPAAADRARYRRAAEDILWSLLTFRDPSGKLVYLARDSAHRGILANGRVAWGYPASSLIYGDYFLLEALNRYKELRCDRCD